MRILLLNWRDVRHPKSGGAELVTMEHAKGWVKAGHRVTWLTASYPGAKFESTVEGVGFVRRWGSLSVYLYAPIYLLVNARLFDVIVDEVHGFPFFSPLFTRKPVVVYIHEVAGDIWDFMFKFPVNVIGKLLERWYLRIYKRCLFWTTPSTVEDLVSRGILRTQCIAIPNPIIVEEAKLLRMRPKEEHPTYIFVSRVVRMKGIEEIIKAFSFIAREQQGAKLWIVGGGEKKYFHELEKMIEEYGISQRVIFYGFVSESRKFELMARAHLLLHASVKEGWGLVVLEAASVGTPAIVYNVPGLKDVVIHGETGIVIDSCSPREMAQEAIKLYMDRSRYGEYQRNAQKWVSSLRWSDAVKQSLGLVKKAISRRQMV